MIGVSLKCKTRDDIDAIKGYFNDKPENGMYQNKTMGCMFKVCIFE